VNKTTDSTLSMGSATFAAKRAADVVFVLKNKEQLGYNELTLRLNETLRAYGESNPDVAATGLDELKGVSRKLYTAFAATDAETAAERINSLLEKYTHKPRLSAHGNSPWHIHVDSDDHAPWAEWFAASSAWALATLLAEKQQNPAGLCASPTCGRPFIDLGKGGGRKYCSPKCATRERVAAYREKKQS
jgi:predicted RNA-binding Zn ribbon-like protein